jgi:hypothetical protein
MRRRIFLTFWILALTVCFCRLGFTQESKRSTGDPASLDEYHFVARGKMSRDRGLNPLRIVRLDNNGEILISCLDSKTAEQLKAVGIEFRQSQLELLVDWDLLAYDAKKKTYRTAFHVYGTQKASAIRQKVGVTVKQLADELSDDLASLRSYLERLDRQKSLFSILYSYVLHSYSMEQLAEEIYQKPQLSAQSPFWSGYAWAIFPIKRFPVGTTVMPMDKSRFFRVSSAAVPGPDFRQFLPFVKDVSSDNRVDDPELLRSFSKFDIFDSEGRLTIPVFEGEWPERLENMAKNVYAKTLELADSQEMKETLGMATQAQAAMFIHYEVRYAFLNHLLEQRTIQAPIDFEDDGRNGPADVGNLVFLIKSVTSSPTL